MTIQYNNLLDQVQIVADKHTECIPDDSNVFVRYNLENEFEQIPGNMIKIIRIKSVESTKSKMSYKCLYSGCNKSFNK